jgi:hypothetical protein
MGSMIDFKRPDGSTCKGYVAEAGKGKPGIVVIQEWWGLNDQIKGVADRFAAIRGNFNQMLTWIERRTPPDAVLVGTFDPLYYLATGRHAVRLAYPDPFAIYYARQQRRDFPEAARLLAWFRQIGACWVVQEPMITEPGQITFYYDLIGALRAASDGGFEEVYRAGDGWFAIYRIRGCPAEPAR